MEHTLYDLGIYRIAIKSMLAPLVDFKWNLKREDLGSIMPCIT